MLAKTAIYFLNKRIHINFLRFYSSKNFKICIVGSGPAGFYTAQHVLKNKNIEIDIYEKLPVPFGLIRYGVAPDHPEIKNVTNSFTKLIMEDNCNFFGNISIGEDLTLSELLNAYDAVVLAYGANKDKLLGIPGEESKNVLSARSFVGWYNTQPDYANEQINLDHEIATVIGHGNVALDVARILLRDINELKVTDIAKHAYDVLKKSKIKKVILVGRRGPLQVAFTIKELRELIKLKGCETIIHSKDFEGISEILSSIPRPRKRLIELMLNTSYKVNKNIDSKSCEIVFCRSPKAILCDTSGMVEKLELGINKLSNNSENSEIIHTNEKEIVSTGLVLKSIGYQSTNIDPSLPFDEKKCIISNNYGKVTGKNGLYCSGWVKTGPVGVILSTMYGSYETGEMILQDIEKGEIISKTSGGRDSIFQLLKQRGKTITTFDNWLSIDKVEQEKGKELGKSREKICSVNDMLEVACTTL